MDSGIEDDTELDLAALATTKVPSHTAVNGSR